MSIDMAPSDRALHRRCFGFASVCFDRREAEAKHVERLTGLLYTLDDAISVAGPIQDLVELRTLVATALTPTRLRVANLDAWGPIHDRISDLVDRITADLATTRPSAA